MGLLNFFLTGMGKIDPDPTRHGFEPGLGYDTIIRNGNGIRVTRPKPTPLPSLNSGGAPGKWFFT